MIIYNMDAYLVSKFIKKSLQNKSVEHADFLTPGFVSPSISKPTNDPSKNEQIIDNSINDYSTNITNIIVDDDDDDDYDEVDNTASKISNGTFILMLLINSYAAYLSWDCNSSKNYPLILKVVFSLFAFMFGSIYIVYFILFKFDECNQFPKIQ